MSKNRIVFLRTAYEDLDRIADYHLSVVGEISAQKITNKLLTSISHLADNPLLAPLHQDPVLSEGGYRKLVSGEYICIYRVNDSEIVIYRIVHCSTDYPTLFK